ncbi:MAG: DUF6324 family protein [Parvibaculum sp.]
MSGGINNETDESGEIQIGPTSMGMVRIFFRTSSFELPMDFLPEEAEEIAAEILEAAEMARAQKSGGKAAASSSSKPVAKPPVAKPLRPKSADPKNGGKRRP